MAKSVCIEYLLIFGSYFTFPVLTNALRGRPLIGSDMKVPSHYQGIVFEETQRPLNENSARSFKVHDVFSEFTYWNYDKPPTENDALKQALTWHNFADLVRMRLTSHRGNTVSTLI